MRGVRQRLRPLLGAIDPRAGHTRNTLRPSPPMRLVRSAVVTATPEIPIRTPDQRLRVFVSSVLGELADERLAVRRAVETLRLTPVMFELGARPYPPRALYRAYLEQSHVFLGIYWQSYGWVAPDEDVSGLEDEYRLSGEHPRLVYVRRPAVERQERLDLLLRRIEADDQTSYRQFSTAAELERLVQDDLMVLLTERFEAGLPASEAAPRRPMTPPPVPITPIVGRDAEVVEIRGLLDGAVAYSRFSAQAASARAGWRSRRVGRPVQLSLMASRSFPSSASTMLRRSCAGSRTASAPRLRPPRRRWMSRFVTFPDAACFCFSTTSSRCWKPGPR